MPPGKRRKDYSLEDVELAVRATKEEGLSLRQASERFSVPKSTIKDHINENHRSNMGRPSVLSSDEENQLLEKVQAWDYKHTKILKVNRTFSILNFHHFY